MLRELVESYNRQKAKLEQEEKRIIKKNLEKNDQFKQEEKKKKEEEKEEDLPLEERFTRLEKKCQESVLSK